MTGREIALKRKGDSARKGGKRVAERGLGDGVEGRTDNMAASKREKRRLETFLFSSRSGFPAVVSLLTSA